MSPCIITVSTIPIPPGHNSDDSHAQWVWATSTPGLILIDGLQVPIVECGVELAVTDVQYVL